ncbi:MAG: glycosyltransferase family 4 protein [Acidimicrobiales bacterium]
MRIALDMTPAVVGHTGVVRYAEMLWTALQDRPDIEVCGVSFGRAHRNLPSVRHIGVPLRILHPLWRLSGQPKVERLVGPIDLVHSMDLLPPPTLAPLVVSLIDVLPATHPQFYSDRARSTHAAKLRTVASAAVIVTCTQAGADDVARVVGIPADRVVVAPLAGRPGPVVAIRPPVDPPYLLAVGVLTPRKGFDVLARAVAGLGPSAAPVLHVGPDGYRADEVHAAISTADHDGRWHFLGEVDDAMLAGLYEQATVVCHPSLAEGFGLVCVEAMERGAPVVAADIPAVREVVGDAAVLVPAGDADALASVLAQLIPAPDRRADLAERGRRRAAQFTWPATAEAVVASYRRVLAISGS